MDCLYGDQSAWTYDSLDSLNSTANTDHNESTDQLNSGVLTTTIEKSLDLSPIRNHSTNADNSYASIFDFDDDLSFDKSKSNRKYFSSRRSLQFSPNFGSTPKPSKTKTVRRTQTKRKKSYKKNSSDISLWDKAVAKDPKLKHWINSFNDEMKKIESSELSVTKKTSVSSPQ